MSTALHRSAAAADARSVRTLLEQGADAFALDGFHRTPLHLCAGSGRGAAAVECMHQLVCRKLLLVLEIISQVN